MSDLKIEDIANRIIDAILNEPHINKQSLSLLITPILKIWLKKTDSYKKTGIPKIDKLNEAIIKRDIECKFWHNKFKNIIGEDNIQQYYEEQKQLLKQNGF